MLLFQMLLMWLLINKTQSAYFIVLATITEETKVTQKVSNRPNKCQSRSWSHHGDSRPLKPREIQIATKPLLGPTTREHRKLFRVETMSLSTKYSIFILFEMLSEFQILNYNLQRRRSVVLPSHDK